MKITGIILAGGESVRMGTHKSLIKVNGKTLLQNALEICRPFCQSVLISSNNKLHEKFGYKVIRDEIPGCGPMGGIYSALKQSETRWNFILSVDAPHVAPAFIEEMVLYTAGFDAIVPTVENKIEPLIAFYNKSALPLFGKQIKAGNFKMYELLNLVNTKWINAGEWLEKYPQLFCNINSPSDLKETNF